VRDEAEIRGHRRTYVGSRPGKILRSLRDARSSSPVFMIDEIDKLGHDSDGDPASALLEVLDPEQNQHFVDHFIEIPFDLSDVLFITTANVLDFIPGALLDRLEVITIPGYMEEEKLEIARRHLVPRESKEHGLAATDIAFEDAALIKIIREYTREAGVRQLERQIAAVCRKAARRIAEGEKEKVSADEKLVRELLGPRRFVADVRKRTSEPGVATGLAVTAVGGDVLFIEATAYPGSGQLKVTGQLGEVMQESAQAAHSWVRTHAPELDIDPDWFGQNDVHVHVPAGAVPKDGPSAGVTMVTALVSMATGRQVRSDVGMTGEVTLNGRVLPIGGVKQKLLAAQRAGLSTVFIPQRNEPDLDDVPADVLEALEVKPMTDVAEIVAQALEPLESTESATTAA
jgi:ATP-dependent Lon protease